MPKAIEQLPIPTTTGDYHLPPPSMLRDGTPSQARTKANDAVIDALMGVFLSDERPDRSKAPRLPREPGRYQ